MAPSAESEEGSSAQDTSGSGSPKKELYPMVGWKYDLFLYVIGNMVDLFFREVVPRGSWKVPKTGSVLFVAAPHANQVSRDNLT
jgi:glycerol-3-phosphate O-acyltransferase/dihydroxyacetone phosphate acyltransferase